MTKVLVIILVISVIARVLECLAVMKAVGTMPLLEQMPETLTGEPPLISVVIPVRNEAHTMEAAMKKRLGDSYPNLEFILIDDRSEDDTGQIIGRLAKNDPRIRPVVIEHLPEGWLGKVHALHQGVRHARGQWLLFTDADIQVEKGTLARVITYCREKGIEHLSVFPQFYSVGLSVDAAVTVFGKALLAFGRSWKIKDKTSGAFGGSGAFSMVKRESFEKTKGFEWLKMELVDDLSLGKMLKEAGARCEMVNGRGRVGVRWYNGFMEMVDGMGRAMYGGLGNYHFVRAAAVATLGYVLDIGPFLLLVPMGNPYLPIAGLGVVLMGIGTAYRSNRFIGLPVMSALLLPLGYTIVFFTAMRAAFMGLIKGGVSWRGTFYTNKELRKGRRFSP
jgi:glycosyltransferase involved in cell wall biosynthesis